MKVVINICHGGFGLSHKALEEYAKRKGMSLYVYESSHGIETMYFTRLDKKTDQKKSWCPFYSTKNLGKKIKRDDFNVLYNDCHFSAREIERHDPDLVYVVESMGIKANDRYAELKVIEIPDDVDYEIAEYDGAEWVAEKHRTWS